MDDLLATVDATQIGDTVEIWPIIESLQTDGATVTAVRLKRPA